jgi:RNA polymerase sigma factor for flagellar operon FliA
LHHGALHDTPEVAAAWQRWLKYHRESDFQILAAHYLPLVSAAAAMAKRGNPERFSVPIGELISDGTLPLMRMIRGARSYDAEKFRKFVLVRIKWFIAGETGRHTWLGRKRTMIVRTIDGVRAALSSGLGRQATDEEVAERIRQTYVDADAYTFNIGKPVRQMISQTADATADHLRIANAPGRPADPAAPVLAGELDDLLMHGLGPVDRKILAMHLDGYTLEEIAGAIGVTRAKVSGRVKLVIDHTRHAPALAKYLGIDAGSKSVGGPFDDRPTFRNLA